MRSTSAHIKQWLAEPQAPIILAIFRIGFGLFMIYEMIYYLRIGLVHNMFFLPVVNFKYDYFYWVKPLPEVTMVGLIYVLLASAICISIGFFFRWACRLFALGYLYLLLLDKSLFNNHIYLFILLAFLLSFTNADHLLSVKRGGRVSIIPRWQILMLQFQFVIVYFYGGLAKLTYDWLVRCEPVRSLMTFLPPNSLITRVFHNEPGIWVINYGGLALDLLAPLILWCSPVRKWGILFFIIFHTLNAFIFQDIGIFPFVMLFSLLLFFEAQDIPFLRQLSSRSAVYLPTGTESISRWVLPGLVAFFAFQLLFPLRGHFLPNQLDWTTIGNRFSWRMKVDTRQPEVISFVVRDPNTQQTYPINTQSFVNTAQLTNLMADPRSIRDFSHVIANLARQNGIAEPQVYADIRVRYNGRPAQPFIISTTDLTGVQYSGFKKLDWVVPLNR